MKWAGTHNLHPAWIVGKSLSLNSSKYSLQSFLGFRVYIGKVEAHIYISLMYRTIHFYCLLVSKSKYEPWSLLRNAFVRIKVQRAQRAEQKLVDGYFGCYGQWSFGSMHHERAIEISIVMVADVTHRAVEKTESGGSLPIKSALYVSIVRYVFSCSCGGYNDILPICRV